MIQRFIYVLIGVLLAMPAIGQDTTSKQDIALKPDAKPKEVQKPKKTDQVPNELSCQDPFIKALSNAYITNPQLHAAVRQQYAIAENVPGALAGWRPDVSVQGQAYKQKTLNDGWAQQYGQVPFEPNTTAVGPRNPITSETSTSQANGQVTVKQNLFQGGQTYYGINQAEHQVLAGEANLLGTEQTVLLNSIQFYLDVWKNTKVVEFRKASETFQKSLLDQVTAQVDVGEKTITDQAQAESTYAQSIADRIAAEAQLQASIASYKQTIGLDPPEKIEPPSVLVGFAELPKNLEEMKKLAAEQYPQVLNAYYTEKAANAQVSVTEGTLLPSLDASVTGSRNWQQDGIPNNANRYHQRTNQGTAMLTLTIPIYQRGSEWSKLRAVNQQRYQALSTLRQQKLAAIQAAVQSWEAWKAGEEAAHQLEISVKAASITVEGRRQQYIVGESTLTDVLAAERDLVDTQSKLVQAQRDFMFYGYTLISLYGNLLPSTLGLPVCRYDVKAYQADVKGQLFGRGDLREDLSSY